jgi:hypothetical protein
VLTVSAGTVGFGSDITLRGSVPGAAAGQEVQILAQPCGFTAPVPAGTVKTTAAGTFSYSSQPMLGATYFAKVGDATSRPATVRIRPAVQLRRVSAGTFGVDVSAGNGSWFTKAVLLQRLDTRSKAWKTVASGTLKANSDPGALVSVSSATITASVKRGTQLRAVVTRATVGACYLPGTSPTLTA